MLSTYCSSFDISTISQGYFNVQFYTNYAVLIDYAVLMKKLCNSKMFCLVARGCRKVNSCKNGKFRNEMIRETRLEMELFGVLTLIYPFLLKALGSIPSATRISFFNISSQDFMRSSKFFFCKKPAICGSSCSF